MKMSDFQCLIEKNSDYKDVCLTILLILQVLTIFIISPVTESEHKNYHWLNNALFSAMALISVFIVSKDIKGIWLSSVFLFVWSGCRRVNNDHAQNHRDTGSPVRDFFCLNVSWIVAKQVFDEGVVTLHRIRGAMVIYLNISLLFALLDCLLVGFIPDAYTGISDDNSIETMLYFSLTTRTTLGYGDILAIHPFARNLAMLEAVMGQFIWVR
jgi:hypothetical protein